MRQLPQSRGMFGHVDLRAFTGLSLLFLIASVGLLTPFSISAQPSAAAFDYQIGETARVDLVAPFKLVVIDPEETKFLKARETARVAPVFRYDSNVAAVVGMKLRSAFVASHERYLMLLGLADQAPVAGENVPLPRIRRAMMALQQEQRFLPLTTNLAAAWARGETGEQFFGRYLAAVEAAMTRYIRVDKWPFEGRGGPWQVRVFAQIDSIPERDFKWVEPRSRLMHRTNVLGLSKTRNEFQKTFTGNERAIGRAVASFLQENCFYEPALTTQARAKKADTIWSAAQFEPGQIIARKGEVVDGRVKAALDQVRAQLALTQPNALGLPAVSQASPLNGYGWLAVVAFAGFVSCWIGWQMHRRTQTRLALLAPSTHPPPALEFGKKEEPLQLGWNNAAPEADEGQKREAMIRSGLIPYLARFLSQALVRRLFWQRSRLLKSQIAATAEAAELEKRLQKIQTQMQDRFTAYEARIADLEKELAAAEEDNRDLIRAKIVLAKQELEIERAKGSLSWN